MEHEPPNHILLAVDPFFEGHVLFEVSASGRQTGLPLKSRRLGLSPELIARISDWVEPFYIENTLIGAGERPEQSDEERTLQEAEGFRIAGDLQQELGFKTTIHYFRRATHSSMPTED